MAQINPRTFADAKQLGDNVYELILTNWGNRGMAQDPNNGSISYPPVVTPQPPIGNGSIPILGQFTLPEIPSLAAIAIAPRSDIDRCIVHYVPLPQVPPTFVNLPLVPGPDLVNCTIDQGFVNKGGILQSEQVLDTHAPLIGQQPGPIIIRAHPVAWFADRYFPLGGGPGQPYGTQLAGQTFGYNGPIWINPELRLLLYFNGRAALPPTARAPFHLSFLCSPDATDRIIRVMPIVGRRRVRVSARNRSAVAVNVTITGTFSEVLATSNTVAPFGITDHFEVLLAASVAIAADQSNVFTIESPGVSFLIIHANTAGIGALELGIDAFD